MIVGGGESPLHLYPILSYPKKYMQNKNQKNSQIKFNKNITVDHRLGHVPSPLTSQL